MSDCYTYFIHCVGTQFVKIGIAVDVNKRLAGLQTANPHELQLLGFKEGGRDLEMMLHMFFKDRHVRGEWFKFRSVERALHIFNRCSISDLFHEMNERSRIHREKEREHSLRNWTPEQRAWLDASLAKISAKMSRGNVRA